MILHYDNFDFDLDTSILYLKNKNNKISTHINKKELFDWVNIQKNNILNNNGNKEITSLNLIPTMLCNGLCTYCYNENNNNVDMVYLTVDKVKTAIEQSKELYVNVNPIQSRIYGGEPLLNTHLVDILSYLQTTYNTHFYISSGLFISDKQLDLFIEKIKLYNIKNISLGVSIDLYSNTRKNTLNLTEKDLYDRALKLLQTNLFDKVILINTITSYTNLDKLFEKILFDENNFYFRIAMACVNDVSLSPSIQDVDKIYNFFINNIKINKLTSNIFPYFNVIKTPNIHQIKDNIYLFKYPINYCNVFNDMITIQPNGNLTHCHMNPYNDKFDSNIYLLDQKCLECNFLLQCFGGCMYRRIYQNRDIYCYWIQKSFEIALSRIDYLLNTQSFDVIKNNIII